MDHDTVVVWGNCQAEPLARLLTEPLTRAGLRVEIVPPVFLVDEHGLARVHDLVRRSAVLISQPVREEYRIPGCGTATLADLLPPGARVVTFPVTFHVGAHPYLVNAHGAGGARVNAPLTDYHDLRAVVAAEQGLDVEAALAWWPAPTAEAVRAVSADSLRKLHDREGDLDVQVADLLDGPDRLWTLDHPSNVVLAGLAERLLEHLDVAGPVEVPEREFLAARRAPVEPAVLAAHDWSPDAAREHWIVDRRDVPPAELLAAHLGLYAERPDIVTDTRTRYAARLAALDL